MANPAAALAQRGGGGMTDPGMSMLIFMAGMGFPVFAAHLEKMRPKEPSHKKDASGGLPADAARNPQQAVPPHLVALLAQRQAGTPPPSPAMSMMPPGMLPR